MCIRDRYQPDPAAITAAAQALAAGRLVAFPTETVYGLGALSLIHISEPPRPY